jgi:N utilization substance protein B
VLNSRRVARELALLTMSQMMNRADGGALSLGEMLGRAADMLSMEASERLQEAGADLVRIERVVHERYVEMHESPLSRADVESVLGAVGTAQDAIELLGSALELPAMVAMAGAPEVRGFALEQVDMYVRHQGDVEQRLEAAAQNWRVERMASVDRDVLRLAVAELLFNPEIPVEVCINEAVELAKKYGTADSGRFVNGVLSRFAEEAGALRHGRRHVV